MFINCLACKDVNSKQQLDKCFELTISRIKEITQSATSKINSFLTKHQDEKDIEQNTYFWYPDDRLSKYNLEICEYEFKVERIIKYYFFIQKELSILFLTTHSFTKPYDKYFDFEMLKNENIFHELSQHNDFKYIQILWAFANYYKHNSDKAEDWVIKMVKKFNEENIEIIFENIVQKIISLLIHFCKKLDNII